jgi:N-acetylmuramic acid 6-phosphate etherase
VTRPPPDRGGVLTEQRDPRTRNLHALSLPALVRRIQAEDRTVHAAVARARPALTAFIAAAAPGFAAGGRLVYVGAGTSGRLGVLDAAECPPTFLVDPGRVVAIIAGGEAALRRSTEGAEDDPAGAIPALTALGLGPHDAVLGIAAGGTTPYTRGAVAWCAARDPAPVTGFLCCAPCPPPPGCGHLICAPTGPEVLTGSTRLKAGTATKLLLNCLSTALMVRAGRVYENLMVEVRATNAKLRDRAARIVAVLTGRRRAAAFRLLDRAGGSVTTAVVMARRRCGRAAAEAALAATAGRLDQVLAGGGRPRPARRRS